MERIRWTVKSISSRLTELQKLSEEHVSGDGLNDALRDR